MSYPYIVLADSVGDMIKRFKAIKMDTPYQRTDDFQITAGGSVDKSAGAIVMLWQYTLKLKAEESDPDYGTLDDLTELFLLNNPNGSPNDVLTLTDHYGNQWSVMFKEDMAPSPITTQLQGPNAIFYVNVSFIKAKSPGGSAS
jgi:hypothetical protein